MAGELVAGLVRALGVVFAAFAEDMGADVQGVGLVVDSVVVCGVVDPVVVCVVVDPVVVCGVVCSVDV